MTLTDYVSRREGIRGLTSIEDSMDISIQRLEDYIQKSGGKLIPATRNNTNGKRTSRTTISRKQKWETKQHYGRFKRLTSDISLEKTWTWLRKGNFKRESEFLRIAAQTNAIRINHIKARIHKTQHNSRCKLFGERDEKINHIISECSIFVQKVYKTRHDRVGQGDPLGIVQEVEVSPCEHNPESVLENKMYKLLLDFVCIDRNPRFSGMFYFNNLTITSKLPSII